MNFLEERIVKEGIIKSGNILKVDRFLNHQMDISLFEQMAKTFKEAFNGYQINKILTIEASGIGIAAIVGLYFKVPVVFAKKGKSSNIDDVYLTKVYSFTHQKDYPVMVSKDLLNENDHVLIIDDFLANGLALEGLADLVFQAGGVVEGMGIAIEKGFQHGGDRLRDKGFKIVSLAIIESMDEKTKEIKFRTLETI